MRRLRAGQGIRHLLRHGAAILLPVLAFLLLAGCAAGTASPDAALPEGTPVPSAADSAPDSGGQPGSGPEQGPAAQAAGTPEEHAAYRAALQGKTEFLLADITAETGSPAPGSAAIDRIPHIFSPYSDYAQFWQFSVLDLDGDGTQEVVVQSIDVAADLGGYLVLHRQESQEGKLYGFLFDWRSFWELKADGSFTYSNPIHAEYFDPTSVEDPDIPAINWAVGTIRFGQDSCEYAPPAITGAGVEEHAYTVNGQPAGEEEYNAAMDAQSAKPDAVWYEFSEEGIRQAFGA